MSIEAENRAKAQSEDPAVGNKVPPMRADDHSDADPAVETPVEARQGFLGTPVLMVLVGGLALAVVAWIGVELFAY
jgi:hypothetical protein